MKCLTFLLLFNCMAGLAQAQDKKPNEPAAGEEVIAVLYGRNVTAKYKEKLQGLILGAVLDEFAKDHKIEPSKEEVDAYAKKVDEQDKRKQTDYVVRRQKLAAELQSNTIGEKQRQEKEIQWKVLEAHIEDYKEVERLARKPAYKENLNKAKHRFAHSAVKTWEINKALHAKYGGRVLFQQFGPEPLDAYRQILKQAEKKGSFQILNKEAETAFRRYFTDHPGHRFYPKEDEAKALSTPWGIEEPAAK